MKLKHLLLTAFAVLGMGRASAQEVPEDGVSYYVYNTETGKFLTRGENWGTRAIVNNYGQPWKVTIQDGKYKLQMLDMVNAGEIVKNLNENYSDNGTEVAYAPTGDANGYTLGNGTGWLGVSDSYYANTAGTDAAKTWQFLTKAQYDAKQVEIQNAQYQALIDASLIDATPATLASVLSRATATDVTTAADLNGVPSKNTWSETQHGNRGGYYNAGTYGLECYQTGNAHITKTVSGLEEGIYKVKVKAMYRSTTNAACLATGDAGYTNSSAYFAANGYTVQIKDWYSSHTGDAAPNNTGDVVNIINNGGYISEFYTYVGPSGTLNLEAVSEAYWSTCWFIFNGVELTKYSDYPTQKMADNTDLTSWLTNPSFESGNMNGWTNNSADGMWTMMTRANDTDPKVGVYWVEKYGKSGKIDVSQTLTKMPAGHYQVSVIALDQASKAKLIAQCADVTVETPIVGGTKAVYTADIILEDNSDLKIGLYCDSHNANSWVGFDDFHLTFVSAELPELPASVTGVMNKDVEAAQAAAIEAYNADKNQENYYAAVNAIEEAKASVKQYENNAVALAAQKALVDGTNIYGEGYEAYAAAYAEKQAAYDNRTLNEVVVNPNAATGWRASTDYNFLLTPWTIGGEACNNFENVLYINTWSVEGDTDGSNFTVPFFEYWTEDAKNLANNTIATSLDVENGLYEATVLVRVRATNGVAATDAAGITLSVNGGEAVGVTEGEQVGESQFTISEVKAEGLVKDGKLNIAFNVADANISWLSFKNVKYTKVRDLTPEEEMIMATDKEIAALNAAIEAAEEKVIGFKEGNYSPYTNAEAIKALADAKAIDTTEPVSADIVNNAKDALESATWIVNTEEVNAIFNGDFEASYSEKEGTGVTSDRAIYTPEGWTVDYKGDKNDMTILSAGDKADNNFTNITALENGGNHTYLYRGKWGSTTNIDVYQNITLPAGQYYIECDAWKSGLGGDGVVFVDDKKASLDGNDTSWRNLSITFTLEEEKTVKVGFTITHTSDASEKFIGFDNFVLKSMPAIDAAKAELEKAINGVNVPTANVGEGAFQYPAAAIAEINSKIETAKSVLENATSAEEIEAQVEIVNAIEIPALKAPAAGQKFNLILTYSGWAYDNKAITYLANARKDQGNYNIQYLAEANANYAQAFTLTNVEGNKYTMSQLDNDGKERYISTGVPYGGNTGQIRTTTNAEDALVVEVIPTATEGVYNIKNTEANNFIGSQDAGVFTVNSHIDFKIAEAKKATATIKVSDSKYATFVAPFAVAIPSGVKAYTTYSLEDNSELVLDEITGTIPANTPVILSADNTPVDKVVSGWGVATTDEYTSGLLTGVYSEVTAPSGSYVLQNQSGRVAFFVVDTEKASPKVTANHAYLTAPTSAAAKILKFPSDKATSIAEVANPMSNVKAIYSVSGAKVNTLQKGLNIVKYNNGQMKKVYIK